MRSSRLDGGAAEGKKASKTINCQYYSHICLSQLPLSLPPFPAALSSWYVQPPRRPAIKKHPPERDFLALNKLAAQSGLTTAHEQAQFRATHDIRVKEKERVTKSRQKIDENITFGITTRLVCLQKENQTMLTPLNVN